MTCSFSVLSRFPWFSGFSRLALSTTTATAPTSPLTTTLSPLAALALLGARVLRSADGAGCVTDRLVGRAIDVSACPDLVPPLAAVAAVAEGTTTFTGAARLRLKESDRLETVSAAIRALGGRARATEDGLLVEGVPELAGGVVDAANDHRIAMMAAGGTMMLSDASMVLQAAAHSDRDEQIGIFAALRGRSTAPEPEPPSVLI